MSPLLYTTTSNLGFLFYLMLLGTLPTIESLIVPQQLPTILSLIYSNIPPIKKGTDSRLGFGFRLGEHADFQVILELGPQKETRPIGDDEENAKSESNFRKRNVAKQQELQLQRELLKAASENGNWLEKWYHQVQANKLSFSKDYETAGNSASSNNKSHLKVPEKPKLPKDIMKHLQKLYQQAGSNTDTMEQVIGPLPNAPEVSYHIKDDRSGPYQSINLSLSNIEKSALPPKTPEVLSEAKAKRKITEELMDVRLE